MRVEKECKLRRSETREGVLEEKQCEKRKRVEKECEKRKRE